VTPDEAKANIGADVTYQPRGKGPAEHGVIVAAGTRYASVRYVGQIAPKATHLEDITLREPPN
jgi:hypothetical protein